MTTNQQTAVQRGDAVPLYHQIFLQLRDEILAGQRPLGSALPTEHELEATFAVSRITARRALDELAAQGLVERKRRSGTRVIFTAPSAPIEANIEQAVESLIAFGRNTRVRVISLDEVPASAPVAGRLQVEPGTPVLRALRLRTLDKAPLGVIESHVATTIGAAMTRDALSTTPLLELLRLAGHRIGGGVQTIAAVAADPALAALLEVEARAPVIRIDRVVEDWRGKPLALTTAQYRGDRYRLTLDLHGAPQAHV